MHEIEGIPCDADILGAVIPVAALVARDLHVLDLPGRECKNDPSGIQCRSCEIDEVLLSKGFPPGHPETMALKGGIDKGCPGAEGIHSDGVDIVSCAEGEGKVLYRANLLLQIGPAPLLFHGLIWKDLHGISGVSPFPSRCCY